MANEPIAPIIPMTPKNWQLNQTVMPGDVNGWEASIIALQNAVNAISSAFSPLLTPSGGSLTGALKGAPIKALVTAGTITLTADSNIFSVTGIGPVTAVTGWSQGMAVIIWGSSITVMDGVNLVLKGGSRIVAAGDVSFITFSGSTATELVYSPAAGFSGGGINLWKSGTAYNIGDVIYSPNAASYVRMECVAAGITGTTEPGWTGIGTLVTDNTVTWIVDDVRDGTPVGRPVFDALTSPRAGYIKANGATLSRTAYPRLWKWANDSGLVVTDGLWSTQTGRFSSGDDSTTFRVPDLRAEFIRGLDDSRGIDSSRIIGSSQSDAIRNITGEFFGKAATSVGMDGTTAGAFYRKTATSKILQNVDGFSGYSYGFNANLVVPTAEENRPRNIAYLATFRY